LVQSVVKWLLMETTDRVILPLLVSLKKRRSPILQRPNFYLWALIKSENLNKWKALTTLFTYIDAFCYWTTAKNETSIARLEVHEPATSMEHGQSLSLSRREARSSPSPPSHCQPTSDGP
jgi:hypothetical protein